jgi:dTDP-4-amino-4,6-dideoxygalactose transaminase
MILLPSGGKMVTICGDKVSELVTEQIGKTNTTEQQDSTVPVVPSLPGRTPATGSIASLPRGINRDTVEEFWDDNILSQLIESCSAESPRRFSHALGRFLQTQEPIWLTKSASSALTQLLRSLRSPEKTSVLLCNFNCPLVPDAAMQAGFEVDTFDVADVTGRVDWEAIADRLCERHAAIIVPHLFGVPADFSPVCRKASSLGIYVIEDCAHTLGGTIGGRMAGTVGDAAIFSFGYDKPFSLGGGGAALLNNPQLAAKTNFIEQTITLQDERNELSAFRQFLSIRRREIRGVWLPCRLWRRILAKLGLYRPVRYAGATAIGPLRAALGIWLLEHYTDIADRRGRNANLLRGLTGCIDWHVGATVKPAWLKAKIVPKNPQESSRIAQLLQRRGWRAGMFNWPRTVQEHLGRPDDSHAQVLAKHALDVPIHQAMSEVELMQIRAILESGYSNA